MSRRTPIEELREEESGVETPSRRRSSRIAAAVTTRRASASEDTPGKITRSKRLSLSQESSLEKDDDPKTSSNAPSTPPKKIVTRGASKSPSALLKTEEAKDVPAMRTRRRGSASSIIGEETQMEERAASPVLSKMTTRRRSLRSMSTSPTSEFPAGNSKPSTPRKSTRAISASPTPDLAKSAPPKLRGRRPSVTEKIVPLEAIEETEPKTEEASATKYSNETQTTEDKSSNEESTGSTIEEASDENLPLMKKKAAVLKKQNLQTIAEKITEENESDIVDDETKNQEKVPEGKSDDSKKEITSVDDKSLKEPEPLSEVDEASKKSDDKITENVEVAEKKALKRESDSPDTPEPKPKTAKYSLSLKSKRSPGESAEEKDLKAVLSIDTEKLAVANSPRRSPRLSTSDSGNRDKTKQPLQTYSDTLNITGGSEQSFHLKLNLSQFDSSQDNLEDLKAEEKSSLSTTVQETGMNTSGSSNTSDKENHHQAKVPENVENIAKKKLVLTENVNFEKTQVEKISTPEASSNQQKSQASRSFFYEPMEVDDFPSDYEHSGLEKKDETDRTPIKNPSEQLKSPKTPAIADKSSNALESPKIAEINKSLLEKSSKVLEIGETSTEKLQLLELPVEASPKQGSSTKQSKDVEKHDKSLTPITKTTLDLSETDVLKVDISEVRAYSLTMELAKASSPKRRSARLLNQSKSDSFEEEQKSVTNSTPKQKSVKVNIGEDLENSMDAIMNDTTVSIDERDLESTKDSQSPLEEIIADDAAKKKKFNLSKELVNEDSVKNDVEVDKEKSVTDSNSISKSFDTEIVENSDMESLQEKEDQNKSIVNVVDKKNETSFEKSKDEENLNKTETKNTSSLEVTQMEVKEIIENPSLKNPQETNAKNNSGEPKFSEGCNTEVIVHKDQAKTDSILKNKQKGKKESNEDDEPQISVDSDGEDITQKDISKSNVTMRRKSEGKHSFRQQEKSNGDSSDEEPEFANDSNSGNTSKKDVCKSDSILKNKTNEEKTSEQRRKSNEDNGQPKFSEDSDSKDIIKKDQYKKGSKDVKNSEQHEKSSEDDEEPKFSEDSDSEDVKKNQSKKDLKDKKDSEQHGKSNKDDEEPKFSEDSDSEDINKKDQSKKDSNNKIDSKQHAKANEDDKELKFSEDSDSEDVNKTDQSKKDSKDKKDSEQRGKSNKDEEPKFSEDSDSEDINKKDQSKKDSNNKIDSKQHAKANEDDKELKFSEDSDSEDVNKTDQYKKDSKDKKDSEQRGKSNKDDEPKFSEDSDSEDNEEDQPARKSTMRRKSIANKNDEDPEFSEDSDDEDWVGKNRSKIDSVSGNKQDKSKKISSDEDDEETEFFEDSDDVNSPFLLYTIKSKKSMKSRPTKSTSSKDNEKGRGSLPAQNPSIVINSDSDTVKGDVSDLDAKINTLIANQFEKDDSSSSSYESVTHFLDDLAEEGDETTPSEGSNDIVERGESIGSTESEIDSDDTYENDSFIDDNEEVQLLSGEEYDLGQQKKKKQPKKKHSRIITVSDSEEENKENELPAANKVTMKQAVTDSKAKVTNAIEEDSDLEKMSTQPYCGLTPPSIMSLRDSLSDSEKIDSKEEKEEEVTSTVLINKEDNLQSLEELKQHEVSIKVLKNSTDRKKISLQLTPKAAQVVPTTFTPNNSILEDESAEPNKDSRKRQSSITIHENIKLQDIAVGSVSDRISKVVDVFCSSVKKDGKDHAGNISLNISLEFLKSPSPSKEDSENDFEDEEEKPLDEVTKKRLSSELLSESRSKMEEVKLLRKKIQKQEELENEEAVKTILKKRLSSESANEPKPNSEEQIKLSAKKQKLVKKQVDLKVSLEDLVSPKKRLSKEHIEKSSSVDEAEELSETISSEPKEDWETFSDNDSIKSEDLSSKKKLTKKDRKKKKKQKNVCLTETVDDEEKQSNISEMFSSDSEMSDDLDAKFNEKYTSVELDEIEEAEPQIIPKVKTKKLKKKSDDIAKQLDSVDDDGNTASELVKRVKKRKRDQSENLKEDLIEEGQDSVTTLFKTKKKKDKSTPRDQEVNETYTSVELDEIEAEPQIITKVKNKKLKKKSDDIPKQLDSVDDDGNTASELVKRVKKRKRDKRENLNEDLIQESQESVTTILKTKKKKDKSKPKDQEESAPIPSKTSNKFKTSESDAISDEVFLEETKKKKKKVKKSPAEEIVPKNVADEKSPLKKKKEKIKPGQPGSSSSMSANEQEESKFQYLPSRILNKLTKNEKLKKTEEMPGTSNQPKKPKLLPSSSMVKRSWLADTVDEPLLPSKTSMKKMKTDVESFHQKDFKNLMLFDPTRVTRMDSKNLLKKKQKKTF